MNLIAIILMFGVIVFVHEFGHFLFAKLNHVGVEEFSIGMGPAIAKWRKKETAYAIRCLPIGGYCIMKGMADEDPAADTSPDSFSRQSIPARLSVLLAGPFFNFLLAFLLSILICHFYLLDPPELTQVVPGSAAEEAGLEAGDTITRLGGHRIYNFRELTLYRMVHEGKEPIQVTYQRDGKSYHTTVHLKKDAETGQYMFGVSSTGRKARNFGEELKYSLYEVRLQILSTVSSLQMLVTGKTSKDSLVGPVGIGHMMNDVIEEAKDSGGGTWDVLLNIINFTLLISANLGVMNLLPIPGLDGGRILFVLIEAIAGKPVPKDKEMAVTTVCVLLLLVLVVLVFFNDMGNLFRR